MKPCNVHEMVKSRYDDPCFFVDYHNIGRGIVGHTENNGTPYIKRTKQLNCWRIVDDELQKINDEILFDTETYLIQWSFEFIVDDTSNNESLFYYWKGNNAAKGLSPLPVEIQNQNPIVERICQWSEPALFFHIFTKNLIVFSCKRDEFKPNARRLFMVRGELESEIHLYEIPLLKENLRSRGIFILVEPIQSTIYYWYGASVVPEFQEFIQKKVNLNEYQDSWSNFKKTDIREGQDNAFMKLLGSEGGNYVNIRDSANFSPRLFYFNSLSGDFLATEVEYPLRSNKHIAPFPFLQSHLYTATQPALFLVDNDKDLWLWQGWKTQDSNMELFNNEKELAEKTAVNYLQEKQKSKCSSVQLKHVEAKLEPDEFINIFPYWNKKL